MSLIVAVADAQQSAVLVGQLKQIDAATLAVADLVSVLDACQQPTPPDFVICTELQWAEQVATAAPRVPVVLAASEPVDRDTLLRALRAGLADAWILPMAPGEMLEHLRAVRARLVASADAAERQLSQYGLELERDQRAGRYIQMGMLPPNPMAIEQYRFQHRIVPSMMMSGDFVDYFRLTDRYFAFYVADVSGHGASSAFVTVLLKNFSRRLRREHRPGMLTDPGLILEWVNRELLDQRIDKHVAMLLGVGDIETNEIRLVNGGHYPPAILVAADSANVSPLRAGLIEQKGKPIGLFEQVSYQARVLKMAPGDRLVLFSDGVMDALGAGSLAAKEALLLEAAGVGSELGDIWQKLAVDGAGLRKQDDMTCLTVLREN
jgi:serine phosphatase RsbU (regulator of sigma subunit)